MVAGACPAYPQADAISDDTETAESSEGTGITGGENKETLSVDFPNAEIRTILRNIADLFDLNLVIPETLEGRASLKLRDVTWKQIFDVLLAPVGYTYVSDGNIIKVVSIESLNVEPAETRIFILNYARASEVAPTVTSMIEPAKGGKLQVDTRSNALVVTERPKRLEKVDEIIQRLDRATAQVMIETKFVEVTDRDIKNIGVNWSSLNGYELGVGPVRREYERESGSEVNTGTVNLAGNGASIQGDPGIVNGQLMDNTTGTTLLDMTSISDTFTGLASSSRLTTAVFDAAAFRVILSALKTQNDTKLVSNPTVVTLNNQEALISIGEQFPIPSYTYNQERGTFEVSGFEYKDIGIIMKVTPQVNNAGLITLSIDPEVSSRNGTTTFGGASGAEIPIISTRRTSTQVAIKDGYTMGIGGLIENLDTSGETKVPLLGDIPGIGQLFRSSSRNNTSRNLIVFITAKILSPEGATYKDVFPTSRLESMGIAEADVPGSPSSN
ncbi:MAG: secretin N-terminal domain-containing protein [Opitutaceae bacterium]